MTLDKAAIMAAIPHRPPILLVDEVVAWETHQSIHARRTFTADDPMFAGHFPGHPVLPGVLGIEAMAQSAALLTNLSLNQTAEKTLFFFMGIDQARFKNPVLPGHTVDLHVKQVKERQNIFWFEGELKAAGKLCTQASFAAKFVLKEDAAV